MTEQLMVDSSSRLRRWFRFSMRKLLLLVTAVSLLLGIWSIYVQPYRNQARVMQLITKKSVAVSIVPEQGSGWHHWLIAKLLGEDQFVRVINIHLQGTRPSDEALNSLSELPFLESLNMDNVRVDDFSQTKLGLLRSLRSLSLRYTKFTDEDLRGLANLPKLEKLVLTGTPVSDGALPHLSQMTSLQELFVRWTRLSEAAVEQLKKALPECEIHHHLLVAVQE